jgi:hypothetical protein
MVLLGDDTGNIVGWIGGVSALITALGGAMVVLWNTYHKTKQDRDMATIAQWEQVADRLQKQLDRQEIHIAEQNDAILQLHEEHSSCQVELSNVYGNLDRISDFCERLVVICKMKGEDPGLPPKKIERKQRPDRTAIEFRMRSLQQRTKTLSDQNQHIQLPPNGT